MTTAAPPTAEAFVARLLATEDSEERRALIEGTGFDPTVLRDAVIALITEAEHILGVDPRRMERLCRLAVDLAERIGDRYHWAMARFKLGEACVLQDRNAEGRIYLDEAQAAFHVLDRPVEAARTRIIWVWATANLGGDREALRAARLARQALEAHGQSVFVATLDMNVGILHCMRGRLASGARYFRRALALFEILGEEVRAERVRQNLGLALSRLGRYQEALPVIEGARDSARRGGRTRTYALCSKAVGETYVRLGRYATALRVFEEAKGIAETLGLHDGVLSLATDLADCYLRLDRPADSLEVLTEIGHLADEVDSGDIRFGLVSRQIAGYLALDQREDAMAALDRAAALVGAGAAEDRAWLAGVRSRVLLGSNEPAQALQAARDGVTIARHAGLRPLLADLRITEGQALLACGDVYGARLAALHARRIGRALDAAPLIHRSEEILGRTAEALSRERTAIRHYDTAIAQFEREQLHVIFEHRDRFATQRTMAYERLARLHLRRGAVTLALSTAERAKSRALADSIAGTIELRPRGTAVVRSLTRKLTAAREAYAAAHASILTPTDAGADPEGAVRAHAHLQGLEKDINDLTRRLQLEGAGVGVADVFGAAPAGLLPDLPAATTLIEFFIADEEIFRFTIGSEGIRGELLSCSVGEVGRLLALLRLNVDATARSQGEGLDRLAAQARSILGRLYDRLFCDLDIPAEEQSLVVVPHGLLHYVPFHALHDGHRYVVERFAVSYAPSAALYGMCRIRPRRRRHGPPLVLGHSAGGRLPHALNESLHVSAVLGGSLRQEQEATRAALAEHGQRAGVIHIAAHGEFRPDAPLFSYVQLADGPLTTADVFNLNIRSDLVTLSACETGRSVVGGGDELVGLSRAFLYAGTAALLVGQWRVDDASTAALMTRFYHEYRRGNAPAQALRIAQCEFLSSGMAQRGWSHPLYWAGFQLIGAA
jgi:tetratricopeptide (TPR) repeat protein